MTVFDVHVVEGGEVARPDLIAYKHYGDVSLWWVIAIVNNIDNPLVDLQSGMTLKVPKKTAVVEALAGSRMGGYYDLLDYSLYCLPSDYHSLGVMGHTQD